MKRLIIVVVCIFSFCLLYSQIIVSGTTRELATGEQISYVTIQDEKGKGIALSNAYGFFSVSLASKRQTIQFSRVGYQKQAINIESERDTVLDVFMKGIDYQIDTIAITAFPTEFAGSNSVSRIVVPVDQLKDMPTLGGERDILKGLQLLPGIQFGQEGTSGIFVRGGSPDQNLILLDDMPVYNVNHLFGFFSLFPPSVMKDVEVFKGGFPAQYGGRLSSVIRMQTKDGSLKKWHKQVSLGLVSGQFSIEGPLVKGKSSLHLAGRKSWLDLIMRPATALSYKREEIKGFATYGFHDLIGKVSYQLSLKDRLYLSFYTGRDQGKIKTGTREDDTNRNRESNNQLQWGNITSSLRYQHIFDNKWFSQTLLGYTQYKFLTSARATESINSQLASSTELAQFSKISDLILKQDFDYYFSSIHRFQMGLQISAKSFLPDVNLFQSQFQQTTIDTSFNQVVYNSQTYASYFSHTFEPLPQFSLVSGIRGELFSTNGFTFPSIQPRINTRVSLNENTSIKAGYSFIKQYLHLLTNSGLGLPTDLWVPATNQISPSSSHQMILGFYHDFPLGLITSVEAYYKTMDNVIEYKEGASYYNSFENWENQVIQGKGRSFGLEFFLHKPLGKTNGWVSYSIANTQRRFGEINQNAWFPFRYDRRHNVSAFISQKLSKKGRIISATWMYQSGARVTVPTNLTYTPFDIFLELQGVADNLITLYTTNIFGELYANAPERNNFTMRPFHKLDIAYKLSRIIKKRERTWTFGVYNLYARQNPYYLFLRRAFEYDPVIGSSVIKSQLTEYSFLIWLPYFSWDIKF